MLSPHIYAALAHERHQTFLAQAEADRRNWRARRRRRRGRATAAVTGRPVVNVRSRWLRFLSPKTELSPAELGSFTDVDHHDHEALGALQYEIMLGSEGTGE
jgi:hypothetical protein